MSFSSSASIVINVPAAQVWDALTKPEIVKQYFFGTNLETTWEIGTPIRFKGEWEGKLYEDKGTVLEFSPVFSLSYNYWSPFSGLEEISENYQIIRYDLEPTDDNGTKLTITQSNVDTQERADHSLKNWNMVLEALQKLVTHI